MTAKTKQLVAKDKTDGRKMRSSRSREKIKASMLSLIRSGNYTPRAVDISDHSGLSMRTVFRHIDDMDGIGMEVNAELERQIMPIFMKPYESLDWKGRLNELIAKRVEVYEMILPLRMHVSLRRFHSEFLSTEYDRLLEFEKASLEGILPDDVKSQQTLVFALSHAIGIASWISLRLDLECSAQEATDAVVSQVAGLIAELD